jgi:hypothetical protein
VLSVHSALLDTCWRLPGMGCPAKRAPAPASPFVPRLPQERYTRALELYDQALRYLNWITFRWGQLPRSGAGV